MAMSLAVMAAEGDPLYVNGGGGGAEATGGAGGAGAGGGDSGTNGTLAGDGGAGGNAVVTGDTQSSFQYMVIHGGNGGSAGENGNGGKGGDATYIHGGDDITITGQITTYATFNNIGLLVTGGYGGASEGGGSGSAGSTHVGGESGDARFETNGNVTSQDGKVYFVG